MKKLLDAVRRASAAALQRARMLVDPVVMLLGSGLVVAGVWQVYRPAAFIVAGAFILVALHLAPDPPAATTEEDPR